MGPITVAELGDIVNGQLGKVYAENEALLVSRGDKLIAIVMPASFASRIEEHRGPVGCPSGKARARRKGARA